MSSNEENTNSASDKEHDHDPSNSEETSRVDPRYKRIGSSPIDIKQNQAGAKLEEENEQVPVMNLLKTANTLSSMMMAHRIALEDDFKLEPGIDMSGPLMSLSPIIGSSPSQSSAEPSLQSRVKDIVHDAFWDLFRDELETQSSSKDEDKSYEISRQLLRDIRQKMIDLLLPQHSKLKQDIQDRMDPQVIDQLSRVHSLDLMDYSRYILDVLSKLCAPVRDEKIQELAATTDIVQLYRGLMDLLELMRLDFANFTLSRFKPHIKAHSQEYEREKFNEILRQQQTIGIDGLEFTRIWLNRAVERVDSSHGLIDLINEASSQANDEMNRSVVAGTSNCEVAESNQPANFMDKIARSDVVNKILNAAYCELLDWSPSLQKLYPETLLFDEASFKQLGIQTKTLVMTSGILLTAFAFANRFRLADDNEFKNTVKSHVITLLTASFEDPSKGLSSNAEDLDQNKLETIATQLMSDLRLRANKVDASLLEALEKQSELFRGQILDLHNSSNRIMELSKRRIMEFIDTLLGLDVKHQQKKFAKMPPPVNIPLGLNCLSEEITLTTAQLVKIIRYNRKVFFQHYQDIILESVLKRCGT